MPTFSEPGNRITARAKALILVQVAAKHEGRLTAELVVQEADPRNEAGVAHALAGLVGWHEDDAKAALRWREDQARAVIRSAEPELIQLGILTISAPYFIHDPRQPPGEAGYVRTLSIKTEAEAAEDAFRAEIERAVSALERSYSIAVALSLGDDTAGVFNALAALGRAPAGLTVQGEGAVASREA